MCYHAGQNLFPVVSFSTEDCKWTREDKWKFAVPFTMWVPWFNWHITTVFVLRFINVESLSPHIGSCKKYLYIVNFVSIKIFFLKYLQDSFVKNVSLFIVIVRVESVSVLTIHKTCLLFQKLIDHKIMLVFICKVSRFSSAQTRKNIQAAYFKFPKLLLIAPK